MAAGGDALFVKADVSKATEVETLIQKAVERFGRLDIAFNNAGIEGVWVPIIKQSEEDWDRTIDVNLKGVWLCLKYEIRQMLKQGGGGSIVNMASITGLVGSAGAAAYSASKHGVIGLTKSAALETGEKQNSNQRSVSRSRRNTNGKATLWRSTVSQIRAELSSDGPIWRNSRNRRSRGVDVLRQGLFHDGPVLGSRWRVLGRAEFSELTARCL